MNPFLKHLYIFSKSLFPFARISQQMVLKHLRISDGLSHKAVFSISQNRVGFMQFGKVDSGIFQLLIFKNKVQYNAIKQY